MLSLSEYSSDKKSPVVYAKLDRSFFNQSSEDLAQSLLGTLIIRKDSKGPDQVVRIVETEAYPGGEDRASHSYANRRTPRNSAMYMDPGTAYVYIIYGRLFCFNISSKGEGAAVLIRSAEPLSGLEVMLERRGRGNKKIPVGTRSLCNGPGKLCQALNITKDSFNKVDITSSEDLFLARNFVPTPKSIVCTTRVGVEGYGEPWASLPMRFYIHSNPYVSIK